jgi:hypothetical protein
MEWKVDHDDVSTNQCDHFNVHIKVSWSTRPYIQALGRTPDSVWCSFLVGSWCKTLKRVKNAKKNDDKHKYTIQTISKTAMGYVSDLQKLVAHYTCIAFISAILQQITAFGITGCDVYRCYKVPDSPYETVFLVTLPCGTRLTLSADGHLTLAKSHQGSEKLDAALCKLWHGIYARISLYSVFDNWNNQELKLPYCIGDELDIPYGTYAKELPPGMDMCNVVVR